MNGESRTKEKRHCYREVSADGAVAQGRKRPLWPTGSLGDVQPRDEANDMTLMSASPPASLHICDLLAVCACLCWVTALVSLFVYEPCSGEVHCAKLDTAPNSFMRASRRSLSAERDEFFEM
jgi:hypothetical protein